MALSNQALVFLTRHLRFSDHSLLPALSTKQLLFQPAIQPSPKHPPKWSFHMTQSIEDRVSRIEQDLSQIKSRLGQTKPSSNWITRTAGAFQGDVVYAEIARLGKEIRDSEQSEAGA
jgi:hypothetical protein